MREHMGLFRGKRIDNGEWVYGFYVRADHHWHNHGIHKEWIICGASANGGWFALRDKRPVKSDSIGECTGLRDKNGKLIFEGDMLRIYEEDSELEADGYCVIHYGRFKDTDAMSDFDHLGWYITITSIPNEATTIFALEEENLAFEIIGNIHDNPELLKGGEGDG